MSLYLQRWAPGYNRTADYVNYVIDVIKTWIEFTLLNSSFCSLFLYNVAFTCIYYHQIDSL